MAELVNRNIVLKGKRTSMRLEPEMWDAFYAICAEADIDHVELMQRATANHTGGSFTSTVRAFLLDYYRTKAAAMQEAA